MGKSEDVSAHYRLVEEHKQMCIENARLRELPAKLKEQADELSVTYIHGGSLDGAPLYDVMMWAHDWLQREIIGGDDE